ncbi:2-oxo acid dehydrogenase subunit E2 [Sphingobacterium olei]|uniref:Dihydrolipoamide acetyltransferase component of pyruvate dehydrogenase complex n=1 Tax=Sphingobacterium olei TaxID=2571155 RepID=A0A4U0NQS0_9SPHI|nr:dihydrolipoamide acetyltransferase family protein [Sphingobacterium olei]TJZ52474.1 2-oxo acid dehydrogenase subunit E2 [Sphingobacterium olei]
MGIYKLVLPKMGESVSEATLTNWLKSVGDTVQEDEAVVEIATDKVDSDVPSPVAGKLKEILFREGEVVQVGAVIAILEVEGESGVEEVERQAEVPEEKFEVVAPGLDALEMENKALPSQDTVQTTITNENRFYSPLVKSIAQEEGIAQDELDRILGSGSDGRVTKQDVLDYIAAKGDSNSSQSSANTASGESVIQPRSSDANASTPVQVVKSMNGDEIIEMDRMRRLISDHMVNSVKTSPHVFSVVEADVTNLVNWRNKVKDLFKKREGENITFTPLIIEAISKALKDFPMVNVSVDGYNIIKRKHINIGMAAALPTGNLIVPVIKDADQLSLVGLSRSVNDLANRARANELKPDDTQGGTFTFTNIGAFGNIFGMPIINQPQAAILAVGTIKKKPAVLETEHGDVIAIRHMMYITMSYDHRVIDGALGGTFIKRVADYLESWDSDRTI